VTGSKPYPPSFEAGSVVAKSRGREREREREREAKQETRNPVLGCQVGQARCVAQDATLWASSPRAANVQTKDTSGPNYGNTQPLRNMGPSLCENFKQHFMVNTFGNSFRNLYGEQTSCEGNKIPKPNPKRKENQNFKKIILIEDQSIIISDFLSLFQKDQVE
jgi:hypothetical protein